MRNFLSALHTVICLAEGYHKQQHYYAQGKGSPDTTDYAMRERAIATCKRYMTALEEFARKVRPT